MSAAGVDAQTFQHSNNSLRQKISTIFILMLFEDKTIKLYDPQGQRDHTNRQYMEDMKRFLHRELIKVTQERDGRTVGVELPEDQRLSYDAWKR